MEIIIPSSELRKQLLSAKALDHDDIDMLGKSEYVTYVKKRLSSCIMKTCIEGKTSLLMEIRLDCDDLISSILPDFERSGIKIMIQDRGVKYYQVLWRDGVKFNSSEHEIVKKHVLSVSWDSD